VVIKPGVDMTETKERARFVAQVLNKALPSSVRNEIEEEYLTVAGEQCAHRRTDRRVLLIGGAGYVGSVIAGQFLESGYLVRCMDLLLYRNDVCVLPLLHHPRYEFIYGDHCDRNAINAALSDVTDVIILSGLVGDPITKKYPDASTAINHKGMLNLLGCLNGRGLNRVIFVSTCSNYGLISDRKSVV
jgi:nucleoside-diphosphate-sugar epimerase